VHLLATRVRRSLEKDAGFVTEVCFPNAAQCGRELGGRDGGEEAESTDIDSQQRRAGPGNLPGNAK